MSVLSVTINKDMTANFCFPSLCLITLNPTKFAFIILPVGTCSYVRGYVLTQIPHRCFPFKTSLFIVEKNVVRDAGKTGKLENHRDLRELSERGTNTLSVWTGPGEGYK